MIAIKKDNIKTQDTTILQTEDDVNNVRLFDHDVKLSPIFRNITREDGTTYSENIPEFNSVVRYHKDNPFKHTDVLSVQPTTYYPIKLRTLEKIATLLKKAGYEITGFGELKGNKLAYVELENSDLPELEFDGTSLKPKMWIGTSHDSSLALRSTIKVRDGVCINDFMLNYRSDLLFTAKHTKHCDIRLKKYANQIKMATDVINNYYDVVKLLQSTPWDRHNTETFFSNVLNAEKRPRKRTKNKVPYMTEPMYSGRHDKQLNDLFYAYENSPGQKERGHTLWRLFSSVTYWADHMITDKELKAGSNILNGTRARQKDKAFGLVNQYTLLGNTTQ